MVQEKLMIKITKLILIYLKKKVKKEEQLLVLIYNKLIINLKISIKK